MALLHINYWSAPLGKQAALYFILPQGKETEPCRVVYLLHGRSDDYTIWLRRTSLERYAEATGLAVALLDGARSFYTDSFDGVFKYEQHILETVNYLDKTFHTVRSARGRGIGGLSMGGYGAVKLGFKHPDLFGSITAHSSVLDLAGYIKKHPSPELKAIFGPRSKAGEDPFRLAARVKQIPALYFDCGLDDPLLEDNRRFASRLKELGLPHTYREYPGAHTWEYWDR
ncbi:MAG TPA: alpha/beta hydrolase family protein, partial [bacterium]|nr:alpha/beta hydrolase family protein [bacterium]